MAKFRQQHTRKKKSHSLFSPRTIFLALLLIILGASALFGGLDLEGLFGGQTSDDYFAGETSGPSGPGALLVQDEFLPLSGKGSLIKHKHYALSYSEKHEQAEWVAYELTQASIKAPNVERSGDFRRDNLVKSTSAEREDYKRSGYDRGHMVPAGDMAFSREAMSETFFMSNMSPQVRAFNGGIWRELEENVRDWAFKNEHVYIVTGPILNEQPLGTIGRNDVTIPAGYFKVILDHKKPKQKGIGFILPNEVSDKHLREYMVSIDEVERKTGLDFFGNLLSDEESIQLESNFDEQLWPINKGKYKARIESWNQR